MNLITIHVNAKYHHRRTLGSLLLLITLRVAVSPLLPLLLPVVEGVLLLSSPLLLLLDLKRGSRKVSDFVTVDGTGSGRWKGLNRCALFCCCTGW